MQCKSKLVKTLEALLDGDSFVMEIFILATLL